MEQITSHLSNIQLSQADIDALDIVITPQHWSGDLRRRLGSGGTCVGGVLTCGAMGAGCAALASKVPFFAACQNPTIAACAGAMSSCVGWQLDSWFAPGPLSPREKCQKEKVRYGSYDGGCYHITSKSLCLQSLDRRPGFLDQSCAWCNGLCPVGERNRCEPDQWMLDSVPTVYDYPSCVKDSPSCLNSHSKYGLIYQKKGYVYRVADMDGACYKAIGDCWGCLDNRNAGNYPDKLRLVPCDQYDFTDVEFSCPPTGAINRPSPKPTWIISMGTGICFWNC